jgi:hypothetical protein
MGGIPEPATVEPRLELRANSPVTKYQPKPEEIVAVESIKARGEARPPAPTPKLGSIIPLIPSPGCCW